VKNLIKKNQLMITALAIMIAIAGYLQFAGTNLEEEYLTTDADTVADSGGIITENLTAGNLKEATDLEAAAELEDPADLEASLDLAEKDLQAAGLTEIESLDSDVDVVMEDYLEDGMEVAEVEPEDGEVPGEAVFTSTGGVAILSEAKLLKEQTRAKNKETLLEIINSTGLTDAQKQEAVDSMVRMTEITEKEAAAEILLEAKGFQDAVVSINNGGVDVVVNAAELTDAQRAQIEDIVKRKTDISAENIIISTISQ